MTEPPATIGRYRPEENEAVTDVWRRANAVAHPFLSAACVAAPEPQTAGTYLPGAGTHVPDTDGTLVGFMSLLGNEIGGPFVRPASRGKGRGRARVEHASGLKGPSRVDMFRHNQRACRLYARGGVEFVADERHDATGQITRRMAMPQS